MSYGAGVSSVCGWRLRATGSSARLTITILSEACACARARVSNTQLRRHGCCVQRFDFQEWCGVVSRARPQNNSKIKPKKKKKSTEEGKIISPPPGVPGPGGVCSVGGTTTVARLAATLTWFNRCAAETRARARNTLYDSAVSVGRGRETSRAVARTVLMVPRRTTCHCGKLGR